MKTFTNAYEKNTNAFPKTSYQQPHQYSITNEEAQGLTGVVAKARALFENNSTSGRQNFTRPTKSLYKNSTNLPTTTDNINLLSRPSLKQSVSANNVNSFINNRFNVNFTNNQLIKNYEKSHQTDKENQASYVVPFLNQIKSNAKVVNKLQELITSKTRLATDVYNGIDAEPCAYTDSISSSHSSINNTNADNSNGNLKIHAASSNLRPCLETSNQLNLPVNVKQAKLCFENLANLNKKTTSCFLDRPSIGKQFTHSNNIFEASILKSKIQTNCLDTIRNEDFLCNTSESPDIVNLLSSSSTSSSLSSADHEFSSKNQHNLSLLETTSSQISPSTASLVNIDTNSSDKMLQTNVDNYCTKQQKPSNIANKIKKLEKKIVKNDEFSTHHKQHNQLISSSTSSSSSTDSFIASSVASNNLKFSQSPKFLQLFQKQMSLSSNEEMIDNNETDIKQNMNLKSILRKGTSSSSIGSTSSSTSSSDSNLVEEISSSDQIKIDSTSCVLPSNMLLSTKSNVMNKASAVNNISSHILKSSNIQYKFKTDTNNNFHYTEKVASQNSHCSTGLVKNNAAFFNKNSNMSTNNGNSTSNVGIKKVNKNATTAREALLRWCRNRTQEYSDLSIDNFSSSWSNGLAFCALIHHFMPDSFDYNSLDAKNIRFNFELAFKIAEEKAGIVPLLDVEDMIEMGNSPDWKCVFTYVHSIYQRFKEAA